MGSFHCCIEIEQCIHRKNNSGILSVLNEEETSRDVSNNDDLPHEESKTEGQDELENKVVPSLDV